MFSDKEHTILGAIGTLLSSLFIWRNRAALSRRTIKIASADAEAFERLSRIAERAERQLEAQSKEFAQRRDELEKEKLFYVDQVKDLVAEVRELRDNNAQLRSLNSSLKDEIEKIRKSNIKAA